MIAMDKLVPLTTQTMTMSPCQGAVGYTVSPGKYGQNHKALRQAVNKSGLRLVFVDRWAE